MLQLQYQELSQVFFPQQEWRWLRQPAAFSELNPFFFLFGAEIEGYGPWAWHPRGGAVSLETATEVQVPILLLKEKCSELEGFLLYVHTTFQTEAPQEVEWTRILKTLKERFHVDLAEQGLPPLLKETLRACGLEPHLGSLATRARFQFLNDEETKFLFDRKWGPDAFELLESLPPALRAAFLKATARSALSSARAKEASQSLVYVFRKLGEATALKLLAQNYKSGEELQLALLHASQPELARLSQMRLERLRALAPPPRTAVFGDPSFESDQLKISHNPKNIGDFEAFKTWVANPRTTERLRQLLEIYQ